MKLVIALIFFAIVWGLASPESDEVRKERQKRDKDKKS